jgi:hypothetical protein
MPLCSWFVRASSTHHRCARKPARPTGRGRAILPPGPAQADRHRPGPGRPGPQPGQSASCRPGNRRTRLRASHSDRVRPHLPRGPAHHHPRPQSRRTDRARRRAPRATPRRRRIIRDVEDTIQRTTGPAEAETLHAELLDRLDAPDLDDDIENRPIGDVIADICRDLGLAALPGTHPWKRRTTEDLATLCARAAVSRATPACIQKSPSAGAGNDPPSGFAPAANHPPDR